MSLSSLGPFFHLGQSLGDTAPGFSHFQPIPSPLSSLLFLATVHFIELSLKYLLPFHRSLFRHALRSKRAWSSAEGLFLGLPLSFLVTTHLVRSPVCLSW